MSNDVSEHGGALERNDDCQDGMCYAESLIAACDHWKSEVERLREAIHAHRVARRYNPRAAWVDARLWDTTGEEV